MPEDEEASDRTREGHKKLKKPHWRAKFFSKDDKHEDDDSKSLNVNDDVLEFLGSSPQKPQSRFPLQKPTLPTPRIDVSVSQRWPDSHEISKDLSHGADDLQELRPSNTVNWKPKKPRRAGLKVSFTDNEPEIIGEGGDEAELPTREILGSRGRPSISTQSGGQINPGGRQISQQGDRIEQRIQEDGDLEPRILVRTPTGISAQDRNFPSRDDSPQGSSPQLDADSPSPAKGSFAERMRANMRAEEGLVFHTGVREPSPANDQARVRQNPIPTPQRPGPSPLPTSEHLGESSGYSLRPTPVPAVQAPLPVRIPDQIHSQNTSLSEVVQPPPYEPFRGASPSSGQGELQRNSYEEKFPTKSMRSAALAVSDDALGDFASRVEHYGKLFSLAAESIKPVMETSFYEWVRCSSWWFLKGRSELETFIRSRSRDVVDNQITARNPLQAYADLAKALWINQFIVPQHPELKAYGNMSTTSLTAVVKSVGNHDLVSQLELHQKIIASLRALTMSMKRNNILPSSDDGLPSGLDTSIWIKYPFFIPEVSTLLSESPSKSVILEGPRRTIDINTIMPLGDTQQHFCFSRIFVNLWLTSEDERSQPYDIPCLLSVLRDSSVWGVMVTIASQTDLVNITLQPDQSKGPTWDDVHWSTRSHSMRIRMPRGFELNVQFQAQDFKVLWNIVDYTRKTETSLQPEAGESLVFENVTNAFQYMDSGNKQAFPQESSKRCRIRVFERTSTRNEAFGQLTLHRGFRLIAVSSPKVKTLSSVNHILGMGAPILFSYLRGDDGAPALMIKVKEDGRKRTMIITFHDSAERAELHTLLTGSALNVDESETPSLNLSSFMTELHQPTDANAYMNSLKELQWQSIRVIGRKPQTPIHDASQRALSGALRVCIDGVSGTLTDRVTTGPGELQVSLNVHDRAALRVLRTPQEDITMCVVETAVSKDLPEAITNTLKAIGASSTVRTYRFTALQDLHAFEQALTGFAVLFDGVASSLAISRRRMVVPIYKRWEANLTRIQILRQDKSMQLTAFFSDFTHGECMNFNVKSTDTFETFSRSGKYYCRLVDAKFALPKGEGDATRSFVSLDLPEYPGEHDDITIGFESEIDREGFQEVLPAPAKEASRINALRK